MLKESEMNILQITGRVTECGHWQIKDATFVHLSAFNYFLLWNMMDFEMLARECGNVTEGKFLRTCTSRQPFY